MNTIIVEDETLAAQRLQLLLREYDPAIKVLACLESIEETVLWLQTKPAPDFFLMDIQLSDGHSFEILKQVKIDRPIIFTTAYDNYAMEAFKHLSIDYILKPVVATALAAAIKKYETLTFKGLQANYTALAQQYAENTCSRFKDRFLAKVGTRTFFIQANDVVYFNAENKTTFLGDADGNRFIVNYTIEKLEPVLDPHYFFRINRKMIVHSKMIDIIKPYFNNRLLLILKNVKHTEDIIVSRERVASFKNWADA